MPLEISAALLRNVRSFKSDESMVDCIARAGGRAYVEQEGADDAGE
jgi:hypothetical protein